MGSRSDLYKFNRGIDSSGWLFRDVYFQVYVAFIFMVSKTSFIGYANIQFNKMGKKTKIKQAVIVAGGKGSRLKSLTDDRPKPMVLVNGRPFLEYLVRMLVANGLKEVLILVGYKGEKIIEHFGDGSKFGIKIKYSIGTIEENNGTRLKNATHLLDKHFLFMYCDIYWPLDLEKLIRHYDKYDVLGMMTLYNNKDNRGEYGTRNLVQLTTSGHIINYGPWQDDVLYSPTFKGIDLGYYILNRDVVPLMPKKDFEFQGGLVSQKLAPNKELIGFGTDHTYCTITDINFLKMAEKFLAPKRIIFLGYDVLNEHFSKTLPALKMLQANDYKIFVMGNKPDHTKSYSKIKSELKRQKIQIKRFYFCSHHPKDRCECRLPRAGLFFQAAGDHHINLTESFFIDSNKWSSFIGEETGCQTLIISKKDSLLKLVKRIVALDF